MKMLRLLLGILVPPLGVYMTFGFGSTFLINLLLTIFGWLPGSIHGVWAIAKHEEQEERIAEQELNSLPR
jgi:uncharacterized membrane protein YqaE (UPF0057 family)